MQSDLQTSKITFMGIMLIITELTFYPNSKFSSSVG